MIKFTIKNMEIFMEVVEKGSFSLAAEALRMTQSSVSLAVNVLEKSIGAQLLERNGRKKIELTSAGEMLYPSIKNVVEKSKDIQSVFRGNISNQPLIIGATTIVSSYVFPGIVKEYLKKYPNSKYIVEHGSSDKIADLLDEGKIRVGFVYEKKDSVPITYIPIFQDEYVMVTSVNEKYKAMKTNGMTGKDLLREPIIVGRDQMLINYIRSIGIPYEDLNVVVRVKNPATEIAMVMNDVGVTLLPKKSVEDKAEEGKLLMFELETPGIKRQYYLAFRYDMKLSPDEQAFITFIKNMYNH